MPPRVKVVAHRERGESSRRGRGGRRHHEEAPPEPQPPPRKLLRSRVIDIGEVDSLVPEVIAIFASQGWLDFMSCYRRFYPELVQEFYRNIRRLPNGSYETHVRGTEIELSEEVFSEVWSIPSVGAIYKRYSVHRTTLLTLLLGSDYHPRFGTFLILNANQFPAVQRIVHHMITTILIPKGGSRNEVTERHKFMLYCLLQGVQIDLPHLILDLITSIPTHPRRSLPYAAPLTALFNYCEVDLRGQHYEDIMPTEVYNRYKLTVAMQYALTDFDGDFMGFVQGEDVEEEEGGEEEEAAPEPVAPEGPEPEGQARPLEEEAPEPAPRAPRPMRPGSSRWLEDRINTLDARVSDLQDSMGSLTIQVSDYHQQHLAIQQENQQTQQNILDSLSNLHQNLANQSQMYQSFWDRFTGPPPGPSS